MRKTFLIAAAASLALAGIGTQGFSQTSLGFAVNGAARNLGTSSLVQPVKADSKLYEFCKKVIDDMQQGTFSSGSGDFVASDCIGIFIEAMIAGSMAAGQPGQPGKSGDGGIGMPGGRGGAAGQPGQDGQGLPGLPGGKGGAAGGSNEGASDDADVDQALLDYCDAVLRQSRRGNAAAEPVESEDYDLSDCMDYFASFGTPGGKNTNRGSGARSGRDGPSISGGQGGKGGAPGSGPGGASGGAGGAGVGGGSGGKGGAGGSGY
jgi:hypothetical protein